MSDHDGPATELRAATDSARAIPQLSATVSLTLDDAYRVQRAGVRAREAEGDLLAGVKLGFTSKEKAVQMGVHDIIIGTLTQTMELRADDVLDLRHLIHPRVEPEVAFRLATHADQLDLDDPDLDLTDHVTHVAAALEVIDSRYRDFVFSLEDVVADNTSAARFHVGQWYDFADLRDPLTRRPVTMLENGVEVVRGDTSAILGDPMIALSTVLRLARRHGLVLPPSAIILAGAATAAVAMRPSSTYEARVDGLVPARITTAVEPCSSRVETASGAPPHITVVR